jgi:hypothetical protein
MADYRVAWGHDAAFVDMDKIVPEPKATFVQPVVVTQGISGANHWQGWFLPLTWEMIEDQEQYVDLLVQFNLATNTEAEVTVYAQNYQGYWFKFNGTAHLPIPEEDLRRRDFFIKDVVINITDMEPIA